MASAYVRGRSVWADEQNDVQPIYELVAAMVRRAQRDVEQVSKLGERASPGQRALQHEAQRFIEEMRQWARD